jgi:cobalamin-dependent methionine synthase I
MTIDAENCQVVRLPDVSIPVKAVLRRLGYPSDTEEINGEANRIFWEEVKNAPSLLHPVGVFRLLRVRSKEDDSITFRNSAFVIRSRQVARMLMDSEWVAIFMVTIGSVLEEEVKRRFDQQEMAGAVILDAIGSETTDTVADRMHRVVLKEMAEEKGFSVTPRFSPGYGDWPVTVQGEVLDVCGGHKVGISVNESYLMIPRKSVSAVLGWVRKDDGL